MPDAPPADAPPPCTTKHDDNVIVIVGRVTFGHRRGHRSTPAKSYVLALAKLYLVVEVSEYMTSQLCDVCHAKLVKTRGHSVRHWRCEHSGRPPDNSRGRRGGVELNKDVSAAFNMFVIGLTLVLCGARPTAFCSPTIVAHNADQSKQQHTSTPSSSSTRSKRTRAAVAAARAGASEEGASEVESDRKTRRRH